VLQKRVSIVVVVLFCVAAIANAKTSAIAAKYKAIGEARLGKPSGAEKASAGGGRVRLYANGGIYWSKAGGAGAVYGPTFGKYKSLGAERGKLGYPVTDVLTTPDGGTQTLFRHGYILVGKSGAVEAEVMPNATYTASSVTYSGGTTVKMASKTEALVSMPAPQSGTQTVTCGCSDSQRLQGGCTVSPAGISQLRCSKGGCDKSCVITVVKHID